MLAVLFAGILAVDRDEAVYERAMAQLSRASSLHVVIDDAIARIRHEVWLQKPNRWRMLTGGRLVGVCDGRSQWARNGTKWTRSPAPKAFPEDLDLFGFEPFFDPAQRAGEFRGRGTFAFREKRHPALQVKTTEAATIFGMAYFNRKTGMPLGHLRTETSETTDLRLYLKVELNPRLSARLFGPPD